MIDIYSLGFGFRL